MSIQNNCMILTMSVGEWRGYRLDKTTTHKVTTEAGAASDAARVNKHVVPKEALKDISSACSELRNHFYSKTLPWKDNGDRLITRKLYQTFATEHNVLREKFDEAVNTFIERKYLTARDQAQFRMGDLFDPLDYPSADVLRRKFYVALDIDGVSTSYDFRLEASEDVTQARVTKAMAGLWEKLSKPLANFAERMGTADAIFRDTTVSNLREIVDILPQLNFTDDPELKALGERISKTLTPYEAKDLRNNPVTRKAVADEANEILGMMSGFMNAFGGQSDEQT